MAFIWPFFWIYPNDPLNRALFNEVLDIALIVSLLVRTQTIEGFSCVQQLQDKVLPDATPVRTLWVLCVPDMAIKQFVRKLTLHVIGEVGS